MSVTHPPAMSATSEPASEPITLTDAKNYLRIDHDADDDLIASLISSVRQEAEEYTARSFISHGRRLIYEECAPEEIILPMGPVLAITSVSTYNIVGDTTTVIDGADYYLAPGFDRLCFGGALYADRITVDYTAGYGANASDVPHTLKLGLKIALAARYYDREGKAPLPDGAKKAYAIFKPVRI